MNFIYVRCAFVMIIFTHVRCAFLGLYVICGWICDEFVDVHFYIWHLVIWYFICDVNLVNLGYFIDVRVIIFLMDL